MYYVKMQQKKKKVFYRPVAIDRVEGLQLSQIWAWEGVKDQTRDWAWALLALFRGAYLFGLLAFVLFHFCSVDSCLYFAARPLTVYTTIFLEVKKNAKERNLKTGMLVK